MIPLGVVDRHLGDEIVLERVIIDMGLKRQPVFLGERPGEALGFERTHIDQDVGESLAGLFALVRLLEVLGRNP
jgi:hypothetical protein